MSFINFSYFILKKERSALFPHSSRVFCFFSASLVSSRPYSTFNFSYFLFHQQSYSVHLHQKQQIVDEFLSLFLYVCIAFFCVLDKGNFDEIFSCYYSLSESILSFNNYVHFYRVILFWVFHLTPFSSVLNVQRQLLLCKSGCRQDISCSAVSNKRAYLVRLVGPVIWTVIIACDYFTLTVLDGILHGQ